MSDLLLDFTSSNRFIRKGRVLFRQDDPVMSLFVIERGQMQLLRRQKNGVALVLQRGTKGTILAEASLFVDHYHCDAAALTDVTVRAIPRKYVRRRFEKDAKFAEAWANHLSAEVRSARLQLEILACRTVAERLNLWLGQHGELPEKGSWKDVAAVIGTSPEALYRELAGRRRQLKHG